MLTHTQHRILALMAVLLVTLSGAAKVGDEFMEKDANGNRLLFRVTSDANVMVYHKGKTYFDYKEVRVPETVNYKGQQYTVNELEANCFEDCNVQRVSLPGSISVLPAAVFKRCGQLQHIDLPSALKEIGAEAFAYCKQLSDFAIPPTVQKIGPEAFFFCEKITSVVIPEGITALPTAAGKAVGVFMNCATLETVQLPSTMTQLGKGTFNNCWKLVKVAGLHEGINIDGEIFKGTQFNWDEYKQSFDYQVTKIIPKIRIWQKKRDFESVEQYRTRVTKEGQDRRVQDYLREAISQYTTAHPIKMSLGQYDTEYQLFPITSQYGTKYVKVDKAESAAFQQAFSSATKQVDYVMGNNFPQVSSITFKIGGKTYVTEPTNLEEAKADLLATLDISVGGQGGGASGTGKAPELDDNAPVNSNTNSNTFAVIIGNEHYLQVAGVPYAMNDANVFANYCEKTLGLPKNNIRVYKDATYGMMLSAITDIRNVAQAYGGDLQVIFYYAGHGIPNEQTQDAYLMPIDGNGQMTEVCYPLSRLYKELGQLGAKRVVCFMDACFSGSLRGEGMIASARGVAIKARTDAPDQGNMVVFSAAQGDETAYPYNEKGHGLFTYFLLKRLQETQGNCTLGDLADYLTTNVKRMATSVNKKPQTPSVKQSGSIASNWQSQTLR